MTRQVLLVHVGAAPLPELVPIEPVFGSWAPAVYTPPVIPGPVLEIGGDGVVRVNCKYSDFYLDFNADVTDFDPFNVGEGSSDADVFTVDVQNNGGTNFTLGAKFTPITGVPYVPNPALGAVDVLGFKTFDGGQTWRYTVMQPTSGDGSTLAVTIAPSPASDTDAGDGSTPSAPSVQVTATPTGGTEPITHRWTRVDSNGGANFLIDDATAAAPTFSIAAGVDPYEATQTWRDTVTDAASVTAQASVDVTLIRTAPLAPTITPDWDGASAEGFSSRVQGIATASAKLVFKTDGTWELWAGGTPGGQALHASGNYAAGASGTAFEVQFSTSNSTGVTNGASSYQPLSSERQIEASITAPFGELVNESYTWTANVRAIAAPDDVATGDVSVFLEAEKISTNPDEPV